MKLLLEQLQSSSDPSTPPPSSPSLIRSPTSPRLSSPYFGSSFTSRLNGSPTSSSPTFRRRPSTEAGAGAGLVRSRSIIEKRLPLKRMMSGESILEGGRDKNAAWKMIIIQTDNQAHSKNVLERKEHWNRLSQQDWPKIAAGLRAENGLWPDAHIAVTWRLDGSEGPLRMR